MLVTFCPNVSNLPEGASECLLSEVRKSAICMVKNLNKGIGRNMFLKSRKNIFLSKLYFFKPIRTGRLLLLSHQTFNRENIMNLMKKFWGICMVIIGGLCIPSIAADAYEISATSKTRKFYPVRERAYTHSLNGTWKIKIVEGLTVPDELSRWKEAGYDDDEWDNVEVPGNWELQGLKTPEYGDEIKECTGLYRRTFKYQPAWKGKNVILRFDGVHFGYEVFVNGSKVGEWGSAFHLCQFDITPYLYTDRENILCVKVNSRSKGWLFDTIDCWGLVGITRDVELFTVEDTYLEDVTFVSNVTKELDADIRLQVDINRFGKKTETGYYLTITLSDPQNNHVLDFFQSLTPGTNRYSFKGEIAQPALWTAETPNLYRLEVCLVDKNGYVVQRINERVGIRSIAVEGFDLKINHRPVLLRGVCLNEIEFKAGRALSYKERRKQLEQMKAAHINYIRTAHYPFAPDFLDLCDEMGFYVCEEVPFASRGAKHLNDSLYLPELKARAEATLVRDKNHASVIIWSLGNENPYTPIVSEIISYVKEKDPTRPRGLPQKVGDFMRFVEKPDENVDILMGHYLNDQRINSAVAKSHKPILHTEYAHAQGNAFSDFESKYARILQEEKVIGGSIWCWTDQGILTDGTFKTGYGPDFANRRRDAKRQLPEAYQGIKIDSLRFMDTFGDRGCDGIVYADGYPKENFYLVRKLYSPIAVLDTAFTGTPGANNSFLVKLENRFDFLSLHGYQMKWQLKNLQTVLASGSIWLDTPARGQRTYQLDVPLPAQVAFNDLTLNLVFIDPDGKQMHERTFPVSLMDHPTTYFLWTRKQKTTYEVSKKEIVSTCGDYRYVISSEGVLTISDMQGTTLLQSPLLLRVGRKETITLKTQHFKNRTFNWFPYLLKPQVRKFNVQKDGEEINAILTCEWKGKNEHAGESVRGNVEITFKADGQVLFNYNLQPSKNAKGYFLECGLTLNIGKSFNRFHWLGDGSYSSTPGKSAYSERGIWHLHADDIRFDGNRKNVDVAVFADGKQGIVCLPNGKQVGVENINGEVFVSQNAIAAGFGTKFTLPNDTTPMNNLQIKGKFALFMENLNDDTSLSKQVFKAFPVIVPEKPYMKTYGW